ncbi:MAG: NAD(P)H-dependent amine dehydrogenase family protein [Brevinema sp.]
MNSQLKVAQYGCGKMSIYSMRYAMEKGAKIVCAFDANPAVIGKDVGEICGMAKTGVLVSDVKDIDRIFQETKPAVCMVMTMSLMSDIKEAFLSCAKNGINAISTCEEAIYPWNSSNTITSELDKIAKENNCTLCGSGYQDVFWGNLITTLAGATHKITKIKGSSSYNVEDYGIALAKAHGAGLTLADFEKEIASADNISDAERAKLIEKEEFLASYMWNQNGWLCSQLGLTVKRQTQKCVPQVYNKELNSSTLNMKIPAGVATGMSAVVTTETKEGITIESECIGKVYAPEECDTNVWTIYGEPDTTVTISNPSTVELTCATVVNRLPDVVNAPAGYYTTEKMPPARFRTKDLHNYLK